MFQNIPAKARALNATLIKMWEEGYEDSLGTSEIMEVCAIEGSDSAANIYLYPLERRGLKDRGPDGALIPSVSQKFDVAVPNTDKYEMIDVPLNDYKDDKIGQYGGEAYELGVLAATGPVIDMEKFAMIADGAGAAFACFDGTPLFGTSHPVDPTKAAAGTWSNKLTKAAGLTFDTFGEVLQAMVKFPSASPGLAVGARPTHLLIPSDYLGMALDITKNQHPSGLAGAENKWLGLGIKPIVVPNWTRDMWMLVDARAKKKRPFVFQEREAVSLIPAGINPEGDVEYQRGYLRWILRGRYGIAAGYPSRAVMVVKS